MVKWPPSISMSLLIIFKTGIIRELTGSRFFLRMGGVRVDGSAVRATCGCSTRQDDEGRRKWKGIDGITLFWTPINVEFALA